MCMQLVFGPNVTMAAQDPSYPVSVTPCIHIFSMMKRSINLRTELILTVVYLTELNVVSSFLFKL